MTESQFSYDYWHEALKDPSKVGTPKLPVHDGEAHPGFWRRRVSKGGAFVPVAIFPHEGKLVALQNGKPMDAGEIWPWVCRFPVSEEAYRAKIEGRPWPDEDASVTTSLEPPSPGIGHNEGPTDEAEIIKGQIEAASAGISDYETIENDEAAAKAQALRSRLLELSGDADKKREALKRPHLDAGKAVDEAWQPLVKAAKAAADKLRAAISAHETRKFKAEQEAQAKATKEAAEKAAQQAEAGGQTDAPAPPPPPSAPAAAPKTSVRGAYGRAASVKTKKVCTVKDIDAAFGFLKTHKELVEKISELAQRAVDAGYSVPGTEVEEVRDVR